MEDSLQEMNNLVELKTTQDHFSVEYEVFSPDPRKNKISTEIDDIDQRIANYNERLNKLDTDIDRLTNHSDGFDYAAAVICGIVTGIIDATVVGEWNFKKAKETADADVTEKVISFANKQPGYLEYCKKHQKESGSFDSAVAFLEERFHLPGDGAYQTGKYGIGAKTHRLDDFCHHPTLFGLFSSVFVQFQGKTLYINKEAGTVRIPVEINEYEQFVGHNVVTKIFSGVVNWFIVCAKTIKNWYGHLMSDAGTKAGIPGRFLSIITDLASCPGFRNKAFLSKLRDAYVNGFGDGKGQVDLGAFNKLFEGAESKLDIRTENAIAGELNRQAMPVVLNEVLVRSIYFIRRLIFELKEKKDVMKLEWSKIIPFNNRTISRMMTIASGTFTTIDMADAAIHAAVKSAGNGGKFLSNCVLRVNFVGVSRFAISLSNDAIMGAQCYSKRNARIDIYKEAIGLSEAKVFYKQADMWIAAENTSKTLSDAYAEMEKAIETHLVCLEENEKDLETIGEYAATINEKNEGLINEIQDALDWE